MPSEPLPPLEAAESPDEKQLCTGCMAPNEPDANFCAECGAPISSYAATGPFEHLFAEGYMYRQAVQKPRSLIVVLGIWFIFGIPVVAGVAIMLTGRNLGPYYVTAGGIFLPVSVVMIWKTTRSYLARPRAEETPDT